MRILLCLCGAGVFSAALLWVPTHSRSHKVSASSSVTSFADASVGAAPAGSRAVATPETGTFLGFDRNIYPGDDALPILRKTFAFSGYWLGPAPGEKINTFRGKRALLQS